MIHKARKLLAAAALCMSGLPATAANIVQNPGFELGSAYWTTAFFIVANDPMWAHTGPGMARTSCIGVPCVDSLMEGAYISQLLPTIAGTEYDLSFWVRSFQGQGPVLGVLGRGAGGRHPAGAERADDASQLLGPVRERQRHPARDPRQQ